MKKRNLFLLTLISFYNVRSNIAISKTGIQSVVNKSIVENQGPKKKVQTQSSTTALKKKTKKNSKFKHPQLKTKNLTLLNVEDLTKRASLEIQAANRYLLQDRSLAAKRMDPRIYEALKEAKPAYKAAKDEKNPNEATKAFIADFEKKMAESKKYNKKFGKMLGSNIGTNKTLTSNLNMIQDVLKSKNVDSKNAHMANIAKYINLMKKENVLLRQFSKNEIKSLPAIAALKAEHGIAVAKTAPKAAPAKQANTRGRATGGSGTKNMRRTSTAPARTRQRQERSVSRMNANGANRITREVTQKAATTRVNR